MTRRNRSQRAGHRAEAYVDKLVSDAGFVWNSRPRDFGIDGGIEAVAMDGAVSGAAVLAQVKGTEVGFFDGSPATFRFTLDKDHIDYWLRCGQPVVLICVDLAKQQSWWKRLDTWFSDPTRRARRVVEFDVAGDELTVETVKQLAVLCAPPGVPPPRMPASEQLMSNLLRIEGFASPIYAASTPCRDRGEAWERMRSNGHFESGFVLADGRIFSLSRLDSPALSVLCNGPVEFIPTAQWSDSDDPDLLRRFVQLLNFTLRAIHHRDLVWHPEKKIVYFQAPPDLRRRKVKGSAARSRGRSVFTPYYGRDDETKVRFCRHYAADLRFRRWDGEWSLEINPDYHFTIDGRRDSLFDAQYIATIKRMERNPAVAALVRAWADFLRGEDTLFGVRDERILFGELARFTADASIDERLWIPPKTASADPASGELTLGLWDVEP